MTPEEAKSAAMLMDSGLRRQVKLAYERDGLSVEEIAAMLGIDIGLVAFTLEATGASKVARNTTSEPTKNEVEPHVAIESKLEVYEDAAIAALGRHVDSDNEAISLTAAREILNMRGGKLRPAKSTPTGPSFTQEDMAKVFAAAMSAYSQTLQAQAPLVPVISHPTENEARLLEYPEPSAVAQ